MSGKYREPDKEDLYQLNLTQEKFKILRTALSKGKICLQSEGAPIEFRDIRLELF